MKLFSVVWVPDDAETPESYEAVLKMGGRIIDQNLTKQSAAEVERCLKVNGEGLDGYYITIAI